MIEIVLNRIFVDKVRLFYVDSYIRWLKRYGTTKLFIDDGYYHRHLIATNFLSVVSIDGQDLEKHSYKKSQYNKWHRLGYNEVYFERWYFAFENIIVINNKSFCIIKDIIYEADHHNDRMHNPMYEHIDKYINTTYKMKSLEQYISELMVCELSSKLLYQSAEQAEKKANNAKSRLERRHRREQAKLFRKGAEDAKKDEEWFAQAEKNYGYEISIGVLPEEDPNAEKAYGTMKKLAKKCNIIDDGDGMFYSYNDKEYEKFIQELKKLTLNIDVYIYKGKESEDYEWKYETTLHL